MKIMIEEKISSASKFNRLFQCLVIILANYRSGVPIDDDFRARPICKCEGGGVINGQEIVFGYDRFSDKINCYDDFSYNRRTESDITEKVILDLLVNIDWDDINNIEHNVTKFILKEISITKDALFKILVSFKNNPFGDPLRSFFDFL